MKQPKDATHYLIDCGLKIYYKYEGSKLMCFNTECKWVESNTGLSFFMLNPKPI